MFASRLVPQAKPGSALAAAADRAFEHLRRVVSRALPSDGHHDRALHIWAQLHGLVMLNADGLVSSSLRELVQTSIETWATGMEARSPKTP